MGKHIFLGALFVLLVGATGWAADATFDDWPAYKADNKRSSVTETTLTFPLDKVWEYTPTHVPSPAWPEPGKEVHRMTFDYVFQPVLSDGLMVYGSSADHQIHAVDLASGRERWTFFTEGPVTDLTSAKRCDTKAHAAFFHNMLDRGFYLPPSQFEVGFVSAAHTEGDIDAFLSAAGSALGGV